MRSSSHKKNMLVLRTWVLLVIGVTSFIGFAIFLSGHRDYYTLGRAQRPLHEAHATFRSSGSIGLPTGLIATALFVLNLGYLVRKRLIRFTILGPLRMWMDVHVLTGFIGGGLIVFHSALAPASALGMLATVALGTTLLTGLIGRTIYIQVPRSLEGRELDFGQVKSELQERREELESAGMDAQWLVRPIGRLSDPHTSLIGCFVSMVRGYRKRTREYRQLRRQVLASPELQPASRKILPLARDFCIHAQWLERYHELRGLIASWRFFHRWLAILMLCVVAGHIIVAFRFGDLQLWGGQP